MSFPKVVFSLLLLDLVVAIKQPNIVLMLADDMGLLSLFLRSVTEFHYFINFTLFFTQLAYELRIILINFHPLKRTTESIENTEQSHLTPDITGWGDVPWHGAPTIAPTMMGLAESGVILDQYYVQPICTPTRSAMMTGKYPSRLGMQHLVIEAVSNESHAQCSSIIIILFCICSAILSDQPTECMKKFLIPVLTALKLRKRLFIASNFRTHPGDCH